MDKKSGIGVVIPTIRSFEQWKPLIQSLVAQYQLPQQIVIIVDRKLARHEYHELLYQCDLLIGSKPSIKRELVTNISHDFVPGKGVSAVRNRGIQMIEYQWCLCIDDDNVVDADFLMLLKDRRQIYTQEIYPEIVIFPTMMKGHSHQIQHRGYSPTWYGALRHYSICQFHEVPHKAPYLQQLVACATNCLFGRTQFFLQYPLDETMEFVYEDIEWTARLARRARIINDDRIRVYHCETHKTPLQKRYIHTPQSCYRKGYHRFLLAEQLCTNRFEYRIFAWFGVWIHTIVLSLLIIRWERQTMRRSLQSFWAGSFHGLWQCVVFDRDG